MTWKYVSGFKTLKNIANNNWSKHPYSYTCINIKISTKGDREPKAVIIEVRHQNVMATKLSVSVK